MKQGMFKQVLSAMVLTMSLAGGAAFASADSVQFSENGSYQAAVVESAPTASMQSDIRGYSENGSYQAAVIKNAPAAVKSADVRGYSENGSFVAASAFENN
ncbi:MAG: hypothetical protein SOR58_08815 [Megasphaera massiliensis]|jgi:hypothetical protein|uniref:hypothetical protein n=1 Tax=Megasphaera massiliensis TaxID=1232428 RepID=UPI002A74F0B7|nr:hypothetical protein [Megasphaera massiliensis]MDY2966285.1 hypothetical protein [Megasphaera massiliensis]